MDIKALEDFEFYDKVSEETIEKYQGLIPEQLMEVWKEYGYGSFYNGYLKIINPDEYREVLDNSYIDSKISIPIFTTGFGDIIIFEENKYVILVEYRKNTFKVLYSKFKFFFGDLVTGTVLIRNLDKSLYNDAILQYDELEYDECFGFTPLLPLGGKESIDNLQKVKIKPHIDLITQLVGIVGNNQ